MIASCQDNSLVLWKYNMTTLLYVFAQKILGHTNTIYSLSTKNAADVVVSGSVDFTIKVWVYNVVTGLYDLNQTISTGSAVN